MRKDCEELRSELGIVGDEGGTAKGIVHVDSGAEECFERVGKAGQTHRFGIATEAGEKAKDAFGCAGKGADEAREEEESTPEKADTKDEQLNIEGEIDDGGTGIGKGDDDGKGEGKDGKVKDSNRVDAGGDDLPLIFGEGAVLDGELVAGFAQPTTLGGCRKQIAISEGKPFPAVFKHMIHGSA